MDRTVCIWIPQFELRSRMVADPANVEANLERGAIILADAGKNHLRVHDASPAARRAGVMPGMPLVTARALCPQARVLSPDVHCLNVARDTVLRILGQFSPDVGHDREESFFFGLSGLGRLYPDEQVLVERLQTALSSLHLPSVVVIADHPLSAWILAHALPPPRRGQRQRIVPRGEDDARLADVPLTALPASESLAAVWRVLGWQNVAQLAALPRDALLRRFGQKGGEWVLRLRGDAQAIASWIVRETPPIQEEHVLHLDDPLADRQALLFVHKTVLDQLLRQIAATGRALAGLEVTLQLGDAARSRLVHDIAPLRPTRDGRTLLNLIGIWLSAAILPAPVESVRMRATALAAQAPRQLQLFDRQAQGARDAGAQLVTQLRAAFGEGAVVCPTLTDRYLPEARVVWRPISPREVSASADARPHGSEKSTLPGAATVLRLVDPPQKMRLRGSGFFAIGEGAPWQEIRRLDGPTQLEGEWWDNGFERAYFLLLSATDELLLVFRDRSGQMFLQAYFD